MSSQLAAVAKALVAPGKGILAADESTGTANKRFAALNIPQTEEMRRKYREMLFSAPGFGDYFSGVILFDETIRQSDSKGKSFVSVLKDAGTLPGIKLDTGAHPLALGGPDEKVTEGLDGLAARVDEYVTLGAEFAKWRAVIAIDRGIPTYRCIQANAQALARYAAICQAGGLVPIVEPEILMDGDHSKHTLERSFEVHERVLPIVFEQLAIADVKFEEMLLKPSMVIPGLTSGEKASVRQVADATLTVLMRWVPPATGGIAFLSGGQSDEEATAHLNEINVLAHERRAPWNITFSYGRALQQPALHVWLGDSANNLKAQVAMMRRARLVSLASVGKYTPSMEAEGELALSR
jgi:fructose-bisphosphate aldolase class I